MKSRFEKDLDTLDVCVDCKEKIIAVIKNHAPHLTKVKAKLSLTQRIGIETGWESEYATDQNACESF